MKKINLFLSACCVFGVFACASSPPQLHYSAKLVREKDHLEKHYDCFLSVTITNESNKTINLYDTLTVYMYDKQGNQVTNPRTVSLDVANLQPGRHYTSNNAYIGGGDNGDRICRSVSNFKFYL